MATKSGAGGLVYSVVAIAIIVLIVSTVAVPVIEDSKTDVSMVTYHNDKVSNSYMKNYGNEDFTLVLNGTNATTVGEVAVSLNGEPYQRSILGNYPVIISDSFILRLQGTASTNYSAFMFGIDSDGNKYGFASGTLSGSMPMSDIHTIHYDAASSTITVQSTTAAFESITFSTNNVVALTNTLSDDSFIYYENISQVYNSVKASSIDDFVLLTYNSTISIAGTSVLFTVVVSSSDVYIMHGTNFDLMADYSISYSASPVDGYTDLYDVSNIEITVHCTYEGQEYSNTFVPNKSYYAYAVETHEITNSDIALLDVIPVLLFLVPVMFAVRMIQTRRN